tara:strand:- start:10485 stop:10955 length:471 start_codon:yes stop_codon:yes gene_type:complete
MKLFKKLLTNNIVAISSGGGHLTEMIDAIPESMKSKVNYVTFKNGRTLESLKNKKHYFIIDPHVSKVKYLLNGLQASLLYVRLRPLFIISTGAGIAIPLMLIGKLFGSKIIYIESGARVYSASKTGAFMYKYSNLFIVQYPTMLKRYPNATFACLV